MVVLAPVNDDIDLAEPSRIDERELAFAKFEDDVGVGTPVCSLGTEQQLPGHPEVHEHGSLAIGIDQQVLAVASKVGDSSVEQRPQGAARRSPLSVKRTPRIPHSGDPRTDRAHQRAPNSFDFG